MFKHIVLICLITATVFSKKVKPQQQLIALEEKLNQTRTAYEADIKQIEEKIIKLIEKHNLTRAIVAQAKAEENKAQEVVEQTSFFGKMGDFLWVIMAFTLIGLILEAMRYPYGQIAVLLWALSQMSQDCYQHKPWKKNALLLFGTSLLHWLFKTIFNYIVNESKKGQKNQKAAVHPMDLFNRIDPDIIKKQI